MKENRDKNWLAHNFNLLAYVIHYFISMSNIDNSRTFIASQVEDSDRLL